MFSRLSPSSISMATVTPSLVMTGEPNFLLITTLRPLGPNVTLTASANILTPRRMAWRDSSPCTIVFAIASISYEFFAANRGTLISRSWFRKPAKNALLAAFAVLPSGSSADFFVLFRALAGTSEDAKDFLFFHDEELFAVNLDLRAGILAEQDAIAFLDCQGNGLAFFITAGSDRDDDAFLRLFFG